MVVVAGSMYLVRRTMYHLFRAINHGRALSQMSLPVAQLQYLSHNSQPVRLRAAVFKCYVRYLQL